MSALTRLSLLNRAVVALVTIAILVVGVVSTTSLRQDLFPDATIPQATVSAVYTGAAPDVVENQVTEPIEEAVRAVRGVTDVSSTSRNGSVQMDVQWGFNEDRESMITQIRGAVDSVRSTLPERVTTNVFAFDLSAIPAVQLAVSGGTNAADLAAKVESVVKPELEKIPGVGTVTVSGQQEKRVAVVMDLGEAARAKVDPAQIGQVLQANTTPVPAGQVNDAGRTYTVQVGQELSKVSQLRDLRVTNEDGDAVKLTRFAEIKEEPVPDETLSRVNGAKSLTVAVSKADDGNAVAISHAIAAARPSMVQQLGQNADIVTVYDQAPEIEQSIHDLTIEGIIGLAMAVLVILVFLLSVRSTLITAISIPASLLIAMIGLWTGGYTLNLLTLAGLTIAIGRVVDDSIVVIENIRRHRQAGDMGLVGIFHAVREVAGAITASTITTVAVFLPLAVVSGTVGQIFRPFAVAVSIALLASLIVSLTIVPVLASWFLGSRKLTPIQQFRLDEKNAAARARADEREQARVTKAEDRFARRAERVDARLERRGVPLEARERRLDQLRAQYGLPVAAAAGSTAADETLDGLSAADHAERTSPPTALQRSYLPVLHWALSHRVLTLVIAFVIFVGSLALTPFLKQGFIQQGPTGLITVNLTLPDDTSLDEADRAARKVERVLAESSEVESYQTSVGKATGPEAAFLPASNGVPVNNNVQLKKGTDTETAITDLRTRLSGISDIGEVTVAGAGGGGVSSDVSLAIRGSDQAALEKASEQVEQRFKQLPGLTNVTSDLSRSQKQLRVDLDPAKAARYGMTQAEVGAAINQAVQGTTLGTMNVGTESLDIVELNDFSTETREQLESLRLPLTAKQNADAAKEAADAYADEQERKAKREANKEFDQQESDLKKQRGELDDQVGALQGQISDLKKSLQTPLPPQAAAPQDPRAQQLAQLQQTLGQLQGQREALDKQLDGLSDQRKKQQEQAEEQKKQADEQADLQKTKGTPLRVRQVATVREVDTPVSLTRENGVRTVTITGTPLDPNDLGALMGQISVLKKDIQLPPGVSLDTDGAGAEQNEAFAQLGLAMLLAIGLVYVVMVATFRSLLQPLLLLVSVPFAATGALGLLFVTQTPLDVSSLIGMLMLIGIVVTNAIVLIDLINHYRLQGATIREAIVHGARLRLRPIIMTALATIMALVPMAVQLTGGGAFISQGLAIVVIGGLISSTLLTLVLVPVLYSLVEGVRESMGGDRRERVQAEEAALRRESASREEAGLRELAD